MFTSRSQELELIDQGNYTLEEYDHCLAVLDRIGRWLGGDLATFSALNKITFESILDVGCGGGIFTERLAQKYPHAKVVGIDLNQQAINYAGQHKRPNLHFECHGHLEGSYDVVLSTLMCHHLTDVEIIAFIQNAKMIAKNRVIINDLHRDPLAYFLFKIVGPVCFRNRLVQHDGPLSVLRSFKRSDWVNYLEKAGIKSYSIRWRFPYRWIIEI